MNAPALSIGRLRAHGAVREPVTARLAAEALAAEALAAPQLPPQAVLLLRRLSLAVPPRALERLPDAGLRAQVASAARGAIAHAAARAARPALDPDASDADAVWFGDEAEMLACLARDGLRGRLDRWWWRQLLGRSHPDWVAAWRERPALAPAALRLVERAGLLAPVLAELAAGGVTAPAAPPLPGRPPHAPVSASEPPFRQGSHEPKRRAADPSALTQPSAAHSLRPPGRSEARQAHVAGAAVAQPGEAARASRTADRAAGPLHGPARAAFEPAAPEALRAGKTLPATPEPPPASAAQLRAAADRPRGAPAQADLATAGALIRRPHGSGVPAHGPACASPPALRTLQHASIEGQAAALLQAAPTPSRVRPDTPDAGPAPPLPPAPQPARVADGGTQADAATPLDAAPRVVITRHGRLLFLVNVLLGDGLYPDFTRPLDPGFPLPVWRLLMLIGQRLAGPALQADPLWRLLDQLAEEAVEEQEGPPEPRDLDTQWPVPVVPGRRPTCAPRRRTTLASALRRRGRTRRGALAGWLARYLAALRERLAPALGVAPALVGRAFAGGEARLWVSEAELVLLTPLADHPVAWRLAGLDRDPGPLPGAGRTLRFLFE